ncbi:hypothetical protein MMC30_004779 [Trapelia coarctata]|nr:hypothetical protein [Trapelia coarctata]
MAWRETGSTSHGGFAGFLVHTVIRFFQFVLALTVLGLYGQDINGQRKIAGRADGRWVFAEVVGGLSAITALIFAVPFFKTYKAFGWDVLLFFLWVVVFGIFGNLYIKESPGRERSAVWVDLANMLLWFISALFGVYMFFKFRRGRSLHTGRATV